MGCDIHLWVEIKPKEFKTNNKRWISADVWSKNKYFSESDNNGSEPEFEVASENCFYSGGRNYNLFAALCGVRSSEFSGTPKCISRPKGVPEDVSDEVQIEIDRYDSDGHSHNYNTLKELKEFDWSDWGETVKPFLDEVIPKMEKLMNDNEDVRIVYFFDN